MEVVPMSEHLYVATAQPGAEDLRTLRQQGFRSIINLQTEGEEDQAMSPDEEETLAGESGLAYVHIPVSASELEAAQVDRFREEVRELPAPVLVHCKAGKRSGALSMMHLAVEGGMTADEALDKAHEMGFECDSEPLREFLRAYVTEHGKRPPSEPAGAPA